MFDKTQYLIREHVGMLKLADVYDIFDAETGDQLGVAKEQISGLVKLLRLFIHKKLMPTTIEIATEADGPPLLTMYRPISLLRSKVTVSDADGNELGYFKSRVISLGGRFDVYDMDDQLIAEVKGDWKGWNFTFTNDEGQQIGQVTKKWAGIGKELFTSADNYIVSLDGEPGEVKAALLLAAGLAIDIVYKEK